MKIIVVVLVTLLIFFTCAFVGFSIAAQNNLLNWEEASAPVENEGEEQYNLLIIQVDQLDASKPRLVSVWYVSLFFMDDSPPMLTFAQLYAPYAEAENAQRLAQSFALSSDGEPSVGFLRAVGNFKIHWDSYFVVDQFSTQRILEWINGPGEYSMAFEDPQRSNQVLAQTCQSLGGLSTREAPEFDWTGLAPRHFTSNLRMEIGLSYWNRMNGAPEPVRCQVILAR